MRMTKSPNRKGPTMPDVTIDVEVYCACCGAGLCSQTESTNGHNRGEAQFRVDPCERCLDAAKNKGYDEGHEAGVAECETEQEETET